MLPKDYFRTNLKEEYKVGEMAIIPVYFDSMGAKSMCTFVQTPDIKILIDPGAAIMQPSYPLKEEEKEAFLDNAIERIRKYCEKTEVIVVTHYHYDHHKKPSELPEAYLGKRLYIKDPNRWINYSQWKRARVLYEELIQLLDNSLNMKDLKQKPEKIEYNDPYDELLVSKQKDFGSYSKRREELLNKWRNRFFQCRAMWKKEPWLKEFSFRDTHINFIKEGTINFGNTELVFQKPYFHGIEYAKMGWVEPVLIKYNSKKFFFSSDLHGPTIEDYANWIIKENPDFIVLDGPATYLFGYMLNRTNLNRIIENACRIVRECDFELLIYDHHCLREKKFRERLEPFYKTVDETGKNVLTAAEYFDLKPLVELL
jgi:predicted metallo-beta-lactamase superfamily hydrolase